jgi:hypothetical protein
MTVQTVTLPLAGLIGGIAMLHVTNREARQEEGEAETLDTAAAPSPAREQFIRWAAITLLCLMGTGLLAWQTRAGPAAQLLAAVGAAAFAWIILSWVMSFRHFYVRLASLGHQLAQQPGGAAQQLPPAGEPGERPLPDALGDGPDRGPAARHGDDLRRPRPAADHDHPP